LFLEDHISFYNAPIKSKNLTARESEIIRVLKILGSRVGRFVVVGGYAVNAHASHRFSVDSDLVIAKNDLASLENILREEGYKRRRTRQHLEEVYGGRTREYVKLIGGRRVSVDLFVDCLICRRTGGVWSYELMRQNSLELNVIGLTDSAVLLVPRRELLIAVKAHSGRRVDLRDVIMLSEGADWEAVPEFTACGAREKVIGQVEFALETIGKNEFSSALRAQFGLRSDVSPLIKKLQRVS